jgi:hypothetical protein
VAARRALVAALLTATALAAVMMMRTLAVLGVLILRVPPEAATLLRALTPTIARGRLPAAV